MPKDTGLNDPFDFSDRYNTKLSPELEKEFLKSPMAKDVYDYDARGAWLEMRNGTMSPDARGHLGDKYKKPNHPTFSVESIYNGRDGYRGGQWVQDGNGGMMFVVGETNMMSPAQLQGYFLQIEPGVRLIDKRNVK